MASLKEKCEQLELDLKELEELIKAAERTRCRDLLEGEKSKVQKEIRVLQRQMTLATETKKCYDVKLENYGWDQSDKFVKLYITLKNVQLIPSDQVYCSFGNRSMELKVNGLEGKNYNLLIKHLLKEIAPDQSHHKVKTDMIVVFLKKCQSVSWSHVTDLEKKAVDNKTPKLDTSSSDNKDPSSNLMDLMKQMYETGDDEMKRTINKAWAESQDKKGAKDFEF